ncbi:hypothetical protein BKA64DRAFT_109505 [Cadophora sp. MPI-SDFR-AT-0126]|nr:hypothetical protein BKA64DRAFT_109505 [Leotiomycetes sp. MPI-SDFR-AT-0126]
MSPQTKQIVCLVLRTLNSLLILYGIYLLRTRYNVPWSDLTILGNILPLWVFGGLTCSSGCDRAKKGSKVSHFRIEVIYVASDDEDSDWEDIEKYENRGKACGKTVRRT